MPVGMNLSDETKIIKNISTNERINKKRFLSFFSSYHRWQYEVKIAILMRVCTKTVFEKSPLEGLVFSTICLKAHHFEIKWKAFRNKGMDEDSHHSYLDHGLSLEDFVLELVSH